jgi:hypothetical protein
MGRGNLKVPNRHNTPSRVYRSVLVLCMVCRCEMPFFEAWRTGAKGSRLWRFYCDKHVSQA